MGVCTWFCDCLVSSVICGTERTKMNSYAIYLSMNCIESDSEIHFNVLILQKNLHQLLTTSAHLQVEFYYNKVVSFT